MQVLVFDKGASGAPGSTVLDDLTGRTDTVAYTHAALWGPLTATVTWQGTLEEAFTYADRYLGNTIVVNSPDGTLQWEGMIWSVTFGAGRRQRSRSLEALTTWVSAFYHLTDFSTSPPADLGPAVVSTNDSAIEAVYGRRMLPLSLGGVATTTATSAAARALNERKRLLYLPETGSLGGGANGNWPSVELHCVGFYRSLWFQWANDATTGTADVSAVIQAQLTAGGAWISADYSQMATTGITTGRTLDQNEYVGDVIKRLIQTADGYTFGIGMGNGRTPYLRLNKRYATAIDYVERLDGVLENSAGQEVALWDVRPDTVLRQADFVPIAANLTAAIDGIESVYLSEVTYSTDNGGQLSYRASIAGIGGAVDA
jgi:hypothetical protein